MIEFKPTETTTGLTTIQVDTETRDLIKALANKNLRSMRDHLLWLARREYAAEFGALPTPEPPPDA